MQVQSPAPSYAFGRRSIAAATMPNDVCRLSVDGVHQVSTHTADIVCPSVFRTLSLTLLLYPRHRAEQHQTEMPTQVSKHDKNILRIDLDRHALLQSLRRRTDVNSQPGRHSKPEKHETTAYVNLRDSDPSLRLFTKNLQSESAQDSKERWQ